MTSSHASSCERSEAAFLYALNALPADEKLDLEGHLDGCAACRLELESLTPTVEAFVSWPVDVLRPSTALWDRLSQRIAAETGGEPLPAASRRRAEPVWEQAAPGIWCKLLATDVERDRVSMLVRLEPGVEYPPHRHAGVEELHLLDGELLVNDRTLQPGDYLRSEPGTADARVWSGTGCTCVLITSPGDEFRSPAPPA